MFIAVPDLRAFQNSSTASAVISKVRKKSKFRFQALERQSRRVGDPAYNKTNTGFLSGL
jgi:hypothetical protein